MNIKEIYKNKLKELASNYENITAIKKAIERSDNDIIYKIMNNKAIPGSERVELYNNSIEWKNDIIEEIKAERQKAKEEQERIKLEELTLERAQKEAEKQLKKEQERLQKIFEEKQATKNFITKCIIYAGLAILIFSIVVK